MVRAVNFFSDRDHPKRNRQIETRSFLFDVGWREIDGGSSVRPKITAICDSGRHPIAAFFDGGIRQANHDDFGLAPPPVYFDFHLVGVDAVNRGRIDFCQHSRFRVSKIGEREKRQLGVWKMLHLGGWATPRYAS